MKHMWKSALVALCACASSTAALAGRTGTLDGSWKGVLVKGMVRSPTFFEFHSDSGRYEGSWWSPSLTSVTLARVELASPAIASASGPVGNVQLGSTVRFEVPSQGVFEGTLRDDSIDGTFRDGEGSGSFHLEKERDAMNDVRYTP